MPRTLLYKGLLYQGSTAVCNVCQPVLLIAMHCKGKGSPPQHSLPPSHHHLLLQTDPYRSCLCQPVVRKDWNSCSRIGHLFVMFPGMGYNINFEHTRVTILTEKQERVSLQMQNPFLYK